MHARKQRAKALRRAGKLLEEAWEAVADGDLGLAEKLARRAVAEDELNPVAWDDLGSILRRLDRLPEADRAFRQALRAEPRFAAAWANLAEIYAAEGKDEKAVWFQRQAVAMDRHDPRALARLHELEGRLPEERAARAIAAEPSLRPAPAPTARTLAYDWTAIEDELTRRGAVRLAALLSPGECASLAALFDDEEARFAESLRFDDPELGRFTLRDLVLPLPPLVADVQDEVYARLVPLANRFEARVEREPWFPPAFTDFAAACERAGQTRPAVALRACPSQGFVAPLRESADAIRFPLDLVVSLGPAAAADGGEVLLVDQRPGRKKHEHSLRLAPGDAAVLCTHERLRQIAGVWGLQPVLRGARPLAAPRIDLCLGFAARR